MDRRGLVGAVRAAGAAWWSRPGRPASGRAGRRRVRWGLRRGAADRQPPQVAERARVPGAAVGAATRPGGGVIRFERSSLSVRVAVGGAVFLGWDEAEPTPSCALPGPVPDADTRAVLEPDTDGGWRLVSERMLVTVSRHGTVEVRTPGGELLRRDLPPRWWETSVSGQGAPALPAGEGGGRWMHRSQVAADARFFGLGGRTSGPSLPDGSYPLRSRGTAASDGARQVDSPPDLTMPVQLVVADAGTHLVFHDNTGEGKVTVRQGLEGRGSGHDRPGHSQIRLAGGPLRYWVLAGSPARVLHGWTRLTGAPALPPEWALGHLYSAAGTGSGRGPGEAAARYREHGLRYPSAELQAHGVHLGYGGDSRHRGAGAEPGTREPSGAAHGGDFSLLRSGWAGMQREGGTWGGGAAAGWAGLREALSLVVGLGLCGVPYSGPAVAGAEYGTPSAELYLRWFQLTAYFPLFHVHAANGAGTREPWDFGAEVRSGCASVMAERARLRPYFTTLAHLAHRTGAPYVRPLWWQHPRERPLRDCDDAFLLGDALLVAPVLEEGARSRKVRLPHGRWYETVTGEMHEGPGEVLLDAPLLRIPVLARAGAAVPVSGTDGDTELEVWPPAPGRKGRGLVITDAGAEHGERPAPAERFTVVRRAGATVVTREDGSPVGYPVRLRS